MPVPLMVKDTNKRPTNSPTVEVNGLPEGARSQPGHHAPGYVTVGPVENGWTIRLTPHKPKTSLMHPSC